MARSAFLATLVVGAVCTAPAAAQAPPTLPDHYALTNVRIVTAPGRVIERGTVVVRDGRITAVGPQVAAPTTAIRLDLAGHTVYPGLIDAASSVGLPSYGRQGGGPGGFGGGGGGGGGSGGGEEEVQPGRVASDVWEPTDEELAAVRNAGFTTLGLAFDGGIFPGRVAAVNTGGAGSRVLRTPVAQQVLLGRRRSGYPGTLMASLAFVKQSFYDAQHEMRVRSAWERQPTGPRPDFRPELRALEPVVSGAPVWFAASTVRDLDRIIELAADINVMDYVILGAQEGWRAVSLLKRANRPLIVSLNFPVPAQITGRAFELMVAPVSGPDAAKDQADSAAARAARGNAGVLARAGIPIALTAYGSPTEELRGRVRAAIAEGLSPDEALRALTVTPARVLGIERLVGTIEPGKLANLVVVQGDIFAETAPIRFVFVDGVRYEVPAQPAAGAARGGQRGGARGARGEAPDTAGAVVLEGEWVGEMDGPTGLVQFTLALAGSGEGLTGRFVSEAMGTIDLTGEQTGSEFVLRGTANIPGMTALAISITGRVTGDDLRGTSTLQGRSATAFTARRRAPGASNRTGAR